MNFEPPDWEDLDGSLEPIDDAIYEAARKEAERVEQDIQNAILNDYDGLDVHRKEREIGIETEAWDYPEPDAANGMITERYTWEWFDNRVLKEAIKEDRVMELLNPDN